MKKNDIFYYRIFTKKKFVDIERPVKTLVYCIFKLDDVISDLTTSYVLHFIYTFVCWCSYNSAVSYTKLDINILYLS